MLLYYGHRIAAPLGLRTPGARLIAQAINLWQRVRGSPHAAPDRLAHVAGLQALHTAGYSPLGNLMTPQQICDIRTYLAHHPPVDMDNPERIINQEHVPHGVRNSFYRTADILSCPHILEIINSKEVLGLVESYLGCQATIAQITLRWTYAAGLPSDRFQLFHRDPDDWRFLKLFLYLTDVDELAGPHTLVIGSHRMRSTLRAQYWSDDDIAALFSKEQMASLVGSKGVAWLVDTFALHKGMNPVERHRLALIVQYSLLHYFPDPYEEPQPISSCSTRDLEPYTNRLFVKM